MKNTKLVLSIVICLSTLTAQAGFLDELKKLRKATEEVKKITGQVTYVCKAGAFGREVTVENKNKDTAEQQAREACAQRGNSWVFCNPTCNEKVN